MSVEVIQGEDRTITVFIKDQDGNAYDLTGVTAVEGKFKGTSSTVSVTQAAGDIAVVSPAGAGEMTITLNETDTAALALGTSSFELIIDKSTERRIVQFISGIKVTAALF